MPVTRVVQAVVTPVARAAYHATAKRSRRREQIRVGQKARISWNGRRQSGRQQIGKRRTDRRRTDRRQKDRRQNDRRQNDRRRRARRVGRNRHPRSRRRSGRRAAGTTNSRSTQRMMDAGHTRKTQVMATGTTASARSLRTGTRVRRPSDARETTPPSSQKKESHSKKNVALKQLLTVCGIGDPDSDSEAETSRKEDKMETVRTSPDSTQTTVETKAKRESMDDFKEHSATTVAASKKSSASGKQKREADTLNRSLFLELDENDDPRSSPNIGSSAVPEPSENFKPSAGVKSSASTGPSVESTLSAYQEYDPASPQVPQEPPKLRAVSYNPTPVSSVAAEYTPTKAAVGSSVPERKAAPTIKEDTYVPSTTRARVRLEGPSYVPSAMTSLPKQEEKPKRREEYVPSSVASTTSSSRSVRGRYEEYVPEAVGSASRRHQTTVDYVPTPKREAATTSGDAPTTTSTLPLSEVPEARYRVGGNTNSTQESSGRSNSILDQEIRTARYYHSQMQH
uniref:Putative subtilisin-like serine protease n=1 Tax=Ixodes ricinus TaxID=34613 RepID=A0A6B0VC49_IXORI